jgi:hypothetical protein
MVLKCTKLPHYIPNSHRIYQPFPFQRPQKNYPNWDFWLLKYTIWQPWTGELIELTIQLKKTYFVFQNLNNFIIPIE